ncbi:MAG: DUF3592 domain-containing protein [Bacteroidales bacterium]|nr:DUF3592 domain-containing protein [Bacteroidales bacterium]
MILKNIWNVPFVFGLVATILGVTFLMNHFIKKKTCSEQTTGIIRAASEVRMGIPFIYPELVYTINEIEYVKPYSGDTSFNVGDTLTVCYNPSNPKKTYILESKTNMIILGFAFFVGGIVFMLIGYGVSIGLIEAVWFPKQR